MGLIADRTNTRWGKFRPYLLWGAIPYGICGYLMFAGPDLQPTASSCTPTHDGMMLLSYSVINVPYSSLLGVLSPSGRGRWPRVSALSARSPGGFSFRFRARPLVKVMWVWRKTGDNAGRGNQQGPSRSA